jgi:hypothetical protein
MTGYKRRWDLGLAMLMEWAKREWVPVIDMRDAYARFPVADVYYDGIHLRPFGHELVERVFLQAYNAGL